MKNQLHLFSAISFVLFLSFFTTQAQIRVAKNGQLQVKGNQIVNKNGEAIQLAGPSLFWSNNGWGGEKFYNADAVKWVRNDWKASIIRAAMGVEDNGGYIGASADNQKKVETVVDAAIAEDMYVIIDWHSHHAEQKTEDAIDFFTKMAQKYGHYDHVIFEIYNEPLDVSWENAIKPYAEKVIAAIRKHSDNLVVVGTRTWSQEVKEAAASPIDDANTAYTLHFYAATHKQWLRDNAKAALDQGIALFVTEWGSVEASGNGAVDYEETNKWIAFLNEHKISHCNWALNDKAEGASALVPGVSIIGNWNENQLTDSGKFIRNLVRSYAEEDGDPEEGNPEEGNPEEGNPEEQKPLGSINEKEDIQITPNPSSGKFTLKLPQDIASHTNVVLLDMMGNELKFFSISEKSHAIDLSAFPKGVYILQIQNEAYKYATKLVTY